MRRIVCTLLLYMLTFTFHCLTHAAAFTAGNLIIYRVGNGAGTLSNTGSPVFLDEYKQDGTYTNNSIALPTTFGSGSTPNPLIANGLAVAEGLLTRSADNKYLLFMGYASTIPAATSLSSTSMPSATPTPGATPIARVVGRVDASGNIDTTTALNDAYDKNSPTGAASSDGINLYTAGTGPTPAATPTTTQLSTGVRSTTLGSASSTLVSSNTLVNIRQVNIFKSRVFFTMQRTGFTGLYDLGPVGSPTTPTLLVAGTSPYAFFFADLDSSASSSYAGTGLDTVYIADDNQSQIKKFTYSGGSWTSSGSFSATSVRGLTGYVDPNTSPPTVKLFATTGNSVSAGGGTLYGATDATGYNASITGTATTLATAPAGTSFRGVALAPFIATAVTLISFTATRYTDSIQLNWQTGYEVDNLGFNVYREVRGKKVRLNRKALIAGAALQMGTHDGFSYAWPDASPAAGAKYWLEDVDTRGKSTWHGPISPQPGRGSGKGLQRSPLLGDTLR